MNMSVPQSLRSRGLRSLAFALSLSPAASLHAQFNAIGFEGQVIQYIPYSNDVGIPAGTPVNDPFSYTFTSGNNLQSFQSTAGGAIADTDDVGYSGAGTTNTVPDYYRSTQFLWKHDGFKATPTGSDPGWGTGFDGSYASSGGYANGANVPGGDSFRNSNTNGQYAETFNINRDYSPAAGNLPKAPGLGDQFFDTHLNAGTTSQFSLAFTADATRDYYTTFAFGGRDVNSENTRAYYRIFDTTDTVAVMSGSTIDTPYESWTGPLAAPVLTTSYAASGVTQSNWEYFKGTFSVTAAHSYEIQIMMPEELNFDIAIGSDYTDVGLVDGVITPVPEASSYGVAGVSLAVGFALLRRRRPKADLRATEPTTSS